ncbi:hypothetical protein HHK36_017044 [Tetracentron sinense]|uniref:Uncharacterized protein n=1 Tax=Tetracentron sinense TaxID=13715 RepID=A0A835DFA0_TETSI|nr:hypothetical protein HHK36_017044 [Tetracentron sinense]
MLLYLLNPPEMAEERMDIRRTIRERYQILIAKRLVEEGINCWNLISQHHHLVLWENAVFEIEEQFMKISQCTTRALSEQVKGKAEKPSNRLQRAISQERICLQENVLKN